MFPAEFKTSEMTVDDFIPHPLLSNRHAMTILTSFWYRDLAHVVARQKQFLIAVSKDTKILVESNFPEAKISESKNNLLSTLARGEISSRSLLSGQENLNEGVLLVHGLEGSSRSHYLLGMADKLSRLGFAAFRMNLRNCGGTIHLTKTLYNGGLSGDVISVCHYLKDAFRLDRIYLVGVSLGGNIVLKAAAELSSRDRTNLGGVCAISPSIDLESCVGMIEQPSNRLYEINFLRGLKRKIKNKNRLFPGRYDLSKLSSVNSVREFDDSFTAPDWGYSGASDYYKRASALPLLGEIDVPVLILSAADDPIVPVALFDNKVFDEFPVRLVITRHGGHAGFLAAGRDVDTSRIQKYQPEMADSTAISRSISGGGSTEMRIINRLLTESVDKISDSNQDRLLGPFRDRFWAENKVVEFLLELSD